jgi:alpha-tubulin suppressor-like RCC1 family protein
VTAACSVRELAPTVAGAPVIAVAAGAAHACALRADGSVWCWGKNDQGQLGRGEIASEVFPAGAVGGLGDVREIAASASTTCARRGEGSVWCWGDGGQGRLGSGDTLDRATAAPVLGGLAGATQVAVGASHACALDSSGVVRCWGSRQAVGDGGDQNRLTPVVVAKLGGVRQLVLGGGPTMSHSCALGADGHVHCWGSNFFGQLGDGSTNDSSVPVRVVW